MTWVAAIGSLVALAALAAATMVLANRLTVWRLNRQAVIKAKRWSDAAVEAKPRLLVISPTASSGQPRGMVLLVHAWGVMDPAAYRGLILHLLERGTTILFPLYQRSFFPHEIAARVAAILDAEARQWRTETKWIIGHSAGATGVLDLVVAEADSLAAQDVYLASPADGTGPDGKPLGTSAALLRWGRAHEKWQAKPKRPFPTIHIITSDGDTLMGRATADRIAEYLVALGQGSVVDRIVIPQGGKGCRTHFWPLGGDPEYRLNRVTQRFAKTNGLGGASTWETDEVDVDFWALLDRSLLTSPLPVRKVVA